MLASQHSNSNSSSSTSSSTLITTIISSTSNSCSSSSSDCDSSDSSSSSISLWNEDWFGRKRWGWTSNPSMIPIPDWTPLAQKLMLALKWYNINLESYTHVFWARIATELLTFALKWRPAGSTRNPSMIPILGLRNISYKQILALEWYHTSLESYKHVLRGYTYVFWIRTVPELHNCSPNWGSSRYKIVRLN